MFDGSYSSTSFCDKYDTRYQTKAESIYYFLRIFIIGDFIGLCFHMDIFDKKLLPTKKAPNISFIYHKRQ